jgi:transposase
MQVSARPRWFGIDVSKATFDIALPPGASRKAPHRKFPRTQQGCRDCLGWMEDHLSPGDIPSLVMEATGGYSREMAKWFLIFREGLRISIAQPFRVHYFAKGFGLGNKTDAQDAVMLARFGEVHNPPPYAPRSAAYEQLRALTRERAALIKASVALGNRDEIASESEVAQAIRERMMAYHEQAVADLNEAIAGLIAGEAELARDAKRLQTVPGVGPVVAATLMGELGDLREYTHPKALTAFTGVAPSLRNSGTSVHEAAHMTKHGSGHVRQVLYLAAMASIRGDNTLAKSYEHLLSEGKEPMVALGAVMRKLLVLCRALLVYEQDYDPKFVRSVPPMES